MSVASPAQDALPSERRRPAWLRAPAFGATVTLLGVLLVCALVVPNFVSMRSLAGIVNAATLTGIIAIGVTLLMIAGEFDLSVGPVMAMGGFVFAFYMMRGDSAWIAAPLALAVCALMGLINGLIVRVARIPSFIATLGSAFMYTGVVWAYSGGQMLQTTVDAPAYGWLNGRFDALAAALPGANFRTSLPIWLALVLLFQLILVRTRFGNHVFATGGTPEAAAAQGVRIQRVKTICFVLSSTLAGLAGVLLFSQFKTVRIATGTGEEMKAIAAAVVGGTLLTGGWGSIFGSMIGILLISTLRTAVVLLNLISADNFDAIVGVTIVAAAVINQMIRNRS